MLVFIHPIDLTVKNFYSGTFSSDETDIPTTEHHSRDPSERHGDDFHRRSFVFCVLLIVSIVNNYCPSGSFFASSIWYLLPFGSSVHRIGWICKARLMRPTPRLTTHLPCEFIVCNVPEEACISPNQGSEEVSLFHRRHVFVQANIVCFYYPPRVITLKTRLMTSSPKVWRTAWTTSTRDRFQYS